MTRTMYDAVDANDVPSSGFDLLAGYVDGGYRSYVPLQHRFPGITVVSIDVLNHPGTGQVLDIEKGDARPDEAPDWFDKSVKAGIVRPTLYYSSSNHDDIKRYMGARKFDAWVANYSASKCPAASDAQTNVVAWQKTDHGPHGENIDVSDVFDPYWPHAAPTPGPIPAPTINWTEVAMDKLKTTYAQVPCDANGHGVLDVGAVQVVSVVLNVPDPETNNYPWAGASVGFTHLKSGHTALVVTGVQGPTHAGVQVTVAG